MEINVKRILDEAREKIFEIDMSAIDLGIWRRLMLSRLLQEWSWVNASDSEEERDGKEKGGRKGTNKKSKKRIRSNKKRKIANGLREEFKNEPRPSKKFKPNQTSGDGEEAGPSEMWKCAAGPGPLKIKLTRVGSQRGKKEKEQRPAEEEPDDYAWLFADTIDSPDGDPVPDPNLLFLEKNKEA
ncbi:hypothetical protein V5799_023422 [Amblyomma americanum]|uniref:Uncharacterized protein n=1 Tax=Amblyomma americanum TaxID=6943 RepID=A0AAQ4FJL7_AMBAM